MYRKAHTQKDEGADEGVEAGTRQADQYMPGKQGDAREHDPQDAEACDK
jgi:hypothetical protein